MLEHSARRASALAHISNQRIKSLLILAAIFHFIGFLLCVFFFLRRNIFTDAFFFSLVNIGCHIIVAYASALGVYILFFCHWFFNSRLFQSAHKNLRLSFELSLRLQTPHTHTFEATTTTKWKRKCGGGVTMQDANGFSRSLTLNKSKTIHFILFFLYLFIQKQNIKNKNKQTIPKQREKKIVNKIKTKS